MRKPKDEQWWNKEWRYIISVDKTYPGSSFNWDSKCFGRYVAMQYEFCKKDLGINHKITGLLGHYCY